MSAIRRLAGVVIACLLGMSAGAFAQLNGDWKSADGLVVRINGSEARFTAFNQPWASVHAAGNINLGDLNMRNLNRISTYIWEGQTLWYWDDIWTTFWSTYTRITLSPDGNSFERYSRTSGGNEGTRSFYRSWDEGFVQLGGSWRYLNWFGSYSPLAQGWIWHKHLGYLYMSPSSRPSGMYMYDRNQGWLFTRRALYPYLLRFSDQTWLWYSKNTSNPRWFRNLRTGQWESR